MGTAGQTRNMEIIDQDTPPSFLETRCVSKQFYLPILATTIYNQRVDCAASSIRANTLPIVFSFFFFFNYPASF